MTEQACPYISFQVGNVIIPGHVSAMRFPIYQCALTDALRVGLRALPDGDVLADAMELTDAEGIRHSRYGPDLQPLSMPTCTDTRCKQICQPAFLNLMTDLGMDATLPNRD